MQPGPRSIRACHLSFKSCREVAVGVVGVVVVVGLLVVVAAVSIPIQ